MDVELLKRKTNYRCEGSGEPLLLVHGWGGDMDSMDKLFNKLSENYKCFVLDLPGFGGSENPDKDWGVFEYGDFVKEFIEKVIGEKTIYCGHSFGGSLGIYLAKETSLISKMILIAPAFRRGSSPKTSFSKNKIYSKLKKVLYPFRRIMYRVFFPHSQALSFPHLEENFKKIVTQDITYMLDDILIPVLILWGEQDTFVDVNDAKILSGKLKDSVLKTYRDCEHNLPMVKADEIAEEIICFLENK